MLKIANAIEYQSIGINLFMNKDTEKYTSATKDKGARNPMILVPMLKKPIQTYSCHEKSDIPSSQGRCKRDP